MKKLCVRHELVQCVSVSHGVVAPRFQLHNNFIRDVDSLMNFRRKIHSFLGELPNIKKKSEWNVTSTHTGITTVNFNTARLHDVSKLQKKRSTTRAFSFCRAQNSRNSSVKKEEMSEEKLWWNLCGGSENRWWIQVKLDRILQWAFFSFFFQSFTFLKVFQVYSWRIADEEE